MLGLVTLCLSAATLAAPPAGEAAGPSTCTVTAKKVLWPGLNVAVEGESPLPITLREWPLEVTAQAGRQTARVTSLAGLAFSFELPLAEVPYRTARTTRVARGLGTLTRATRLVASAVNAAGEVTVEPHLAPNVRVDPQTLTCKQLALPERDKDLELVALKEPSERRRVVPTGDAVALRRSKDGPVELTVRWAEGYLPLERLGDRKGWAQVRARWSDGARVQGYVKSAEVSERIGLGPRARQGSADATCSRRFGFAYFGPATLAGGKTIHSRAGGPAWATAKEPTRVVVLGKSGRWIRIMEIAGLLPAEGCYHERAWVKREDLRYP